MSLPKNHSSDPVCPLGVCNGLGYIIIKHEDHEYARACECSRRKDKLKFLGERFVDVKLEDIAPRNDRQTKLKELLLKQPSSRVFLYGKGGTGKTHFLAAIYNYWHAKRVPIKYLDDSMLKDELRQAELNNDFSFVSDLVSDYRHIVIDDVGKMAMSQFYQSALYRLFNEVYKQNRHIFVTANEPLSVFAEPAHWGPHTTRRVEDVCEIVEF